MVRADTPRLPLYPNRHGRPPGSRLGRRSRRAQVRFLDGSPNVPVSYPPVQPHGTRDLVQDRAYHAGTHGREAGGHGSRPNGRGRTPKRPQEPKTPRVAELLRQALEWRAPLKSGALATQAALARREGLTRVRVTQILGLFRLAPEIPHHILSTPKTVGYPTISERVLRSITMVADPQQPLHAVAAIVSKEDASSPRWSRIVGLLSR